MINNPVQTKEIKELNNIIPGFKEAVYLSATNNKNNEDGA
jgi:hypothetical protein